MMFVIEDMEFSDWNERAYFLLFVCHLCVA